MYCSCVDDDFAVVFTLRCYANQLRILLAMREYQKKLRKYLVKVCPVESGGAEQSGTVQ